MNEIRGDIGASWQYLDKEIEKEKDRRVTEENFAKERKQAKQNLEQLKVKILELEKLL